jgi:hypothetical protein
MERSATIKAKDLSTGERQWLATVLHVDLREDDEFIVTLRRPGVRVPSAEQRQAAGKELMAVLGQFHERMQGVPEEEIDAAVHQVFSDMRSGKN